MWILQFLPSWIFTALFFLGIAAFIATKFIKILPNIQLIQSASVIVVLVSAYMTGAVSNNDAWLAKIKDLETKVAQAQAQSAQANTDIVEKTVTKTQVIKQRGQDTIKYIDREVVKYDTTCIIPREFVQSHNQAAEAPK